MVIKTKWYWFKHRRGDHCNRIESRKTHMLYLLDFSQKCKGGSVEKGKSSASCTRRVISICKEMNFSLYFATCTKIMSTRIIDVKPKTVIVLEEHIGQSFVVVG